jgi:Mg-chelatase subunit ChlD
VNYTNNNPYTPPAGPGDDMNFFPDGQAQNLANAFHNNNAASQGNPNGHHPAFVNLGFLAPDFEGDTRNIYAFDCSQHGNGCDSGNAPADRINMPATGYISQSEACIRLVAGHELFHHVQFAYINFDKWDDWGTMPVEGTARMMQDKIYNDLDANAGCITYNGTVNSFLGNPNQTIWNTSYASALFWNYLSEQLGNLNSEPDRGVDFVRRFWELAEDNNDNPDTVANLRRTIKEFDTAVTLESMFHDFTITNYAKDLDVSALNDALKYRYFDENDATGVAHDAVATAFNGSMPPSIGPNNGSVVRWGANYYVADITSECRTGVVGFRSTGDVAAYGLMAIKGDKVDRLAKNVTGTFARAYIQRPEDLYTRLAASVAGLNDPANFSYTFACGGVKLDILEPYNVRPAYVGEKNAPDRFLVRLNVTGPSELGEPSVEGLQPSDFQVYVGSINAADQATVLSGAYVQGQYWLVAQAPTKGAGPDTYPLFVTLGDQANASEPDAIIYQKLILDQMLVVDRSGSMLDPVGSPKIDAAKNAATLFVDSARSDDKIGVVSFSGNNSEPNDDATLNAQLKDIDDANRTAAKAAIQALAAAGFTSIGDGLQKGADEFPVRGGPGEDWLVLLSDGMENEAAFWNNVRNAIQNANIKVNAIALGPLTDQALLQEIANQTGGIYYYVDVSPGTTLASTTAAGLSASGATANRLGDAYALANEVIQRHERLWEDGGTVSGAPVVKTITVNEGGIADGLFTFNWSNPSAKLGVQIQRPDGTIVVDGIAGAQIYATTTHYVAHVGNLTPGDWKVTLSALSGSPEWIGFLSGRNLQGAQMKLYFGQFAGQGAPSLFMRGLPMPLLATLTDQKGPVLGAKLMARVEHPDGSIIALPLLDDGNHGDGSANDGLYGNRYTRTTIASPTGLTDSSAVPIRGSYNVRLDATGRDNQGKDFNRIKKSGFQIFEGREREQLPPDADKDGMPNRYERLHPCLDPLVDDASGDPDQDGIKTFDEWDQGTDPCHPDTDRGGEADQSELIRAANPFDPQDDALPAPVDVEMLDYMTDHLDGPDLQPNSLLIRYPVHTSYAKIRLLRSTNAAGPYSIAAEFDPSIVGGVYRDTGLTNGTTYYYKIVPLDLNGNVGVTSHLIRGTPKAEPVTPRGNVQIAGGKPVVSSKVVKLTLSADPDTTQMMISNKPTFAGAVWEPFVISKTWTLGVNSGYAMVFARFRDAAGNQSFDYYDDVVIKPLLSLGILKGILKLKFLLPLADHTHDHASNLHHPGHDHEHPETQDSPVGVEGIMVWSPDHPDVPPAFTNAQGAFELIDLEPGTYTLLIQQRGYAPLRISGVVVGANQTVDIGLRELTPFTQYLPFTAR